MMHSADHDPIIDHRRCATCYEALSAAWARMAPELQDIPPEDIVIVLRRALLEVVR